MCVFVCSVCMYVCVGVYLCVCVVYTGSVFVLTLLAHVVMMYRMLPMPLPLFHQSIQSNTFQALIPILWYIAWFARNTQHAGDFIFHVRLTVQSLY